MNMPVGLPVAVLLLRAQTAALGQACFTWTQRIISGLSRRYYHALAYDSTRGVTVLFGGAGSYYGETWEWDGTSWTLRSSSGPSPRYQHAMAYDSARGVTVRSHLHWRDGLHRSGRRSAARTEHGRRAPDAWTPNREPRTLTPDPSVTVLRMHCRPSSAGFYQAGSLGSRRPTAVDQEICVPPGERRTRMTLHLLGTPVRIHRRICLAHWPHWRNNMEGVGFGPA